MSACWTISSSKNWPPLLERKRRLLAIMPAVECRVLYLDHLAELGRDLFRIAGERDPDGSAYDELLHDQRVWLFDGAAAAYVQTSVPRT